MIEVLVDAIKAQLSNQVATGMIAATIFGALIVAARNLPGRLWALLERQLITTVDVADGDPAFHWINKWLAAQDYARRRARNLTVTTRSRFDDNDDAAPVSADGAFRARRRMVEVVFSPAPGTHLIRFRGHFLLMVRVRREMDNAMGGFGYTETFTFRALSREVVRDLIIEARDYAAPQDDGSIGVLRASGYGWRVVQRRARRSFESVVLIDGVAERIVDDVRRFFQSAEWYRDHSVPYQRGYLLYGPPGSGKTSLVAAIASRFGRDVYIVNLSSCSDESFTDLMSKVPEDGVVLLEDVDCAFRTRDERDEKEFVSPHGSHYTKPSAQLLTLSGFLNAIDGISAPDGRLLFMTTNHPEALDPAMVRHGRVDMKVEIGHATPEQAWRLFLRFFPGDESRAQRFGNGVLRAHRPVSMAELQEHLIANRDDAATAAVFEVPMAKASNGAEARP